MWLTIGILLGGLRDLITQRLREIKRGRRLPDYREAQARPASDVELSLTCDAHERAKRAQGTRPRITACRRGLGARLAKRAICDAFNHTN